MVLLLCRGIEQRLLGLSRPPSWPRALGVVLAAFVAIAVAGTVLNLFLKAGEEQGLVPQEWDPGRAAPFVANFVVVAVVAPAVEELTYRGLGFAVTRDRWGVWPAVVITAIAFGLAHGLLVALPILTLFGARPGLRPGANAESLPSDDPARHLQRRGAPARGDAGGRVVSDALRELRDRIDELDAQILGAVNERLELVERLWRLKAELGVDRLDPGSRAGDPDALGRERCRCHGAKRLDELVAALLALTKREHERQ